MHYHVSRNNFFQWKRWQLLKRSTNIRFHNSNYSKKMFYCTVSPEPHQRLKIIVSCNEPLLFLCFALNCVRSETISDWTHALRGEWNAKVYYSFCVRNLILMMWVKSEFKRRVKRTLLVTVRLVSEHVEL